MADTDINRQFRALLGRDGNPDELAFFNKFIADEKITPLEINQMIQSMPEYQGQRLNQDVTAYGNQLALGDQGILDKAAATAQSRFSGLGRPVTSAQAGALAQTAQSLATQRQSALADFYGRGLQNNTSLSQAQGQGALERGYGLRDEARQRGYQIEDRNYMKNLYDEYNARAASQARKGAIGQIVGMAGGAALGSYGGPEGAAMGARLGGGFGQNLGGLF